MADEEKVPDIEVKKVLTFIVFGASGDLAKVKTYPALFSLYCLGLLPENFIIAGYARSKLNDITFKDRISRNFKPIDDKKDAFLSHCSYFSGQYNSSDDFKKFNKFLIKKENDQPNTKGANRIFYLAIPPNMFIVVGKSIHSAVISKTGWNRVVVEKPFGRDSVSSGKLGKALGKLFTEDSIYRIDHYLGKEMVQNLMVLRFANTVYEPLWNRHHIKCVIITFQENFGCKGRGGYFDKYGTIRDVMQNHALQLLSLVGMEPPVTMSAEDVRNEKVKLLRSILPATLKDTILGQYGACPQGSEPSYLDNDDVPDDSLTPTFATIVLHINNYRWKGCPFIIKCGKALSKRKAEVRIQFKLPPTELFSDISPNELVLRVQPDEAIYLKKSVKKPGLGEGLMHTELDLSYHEAFGDDSASGKKLYLPDAYERLIRDVIIGDHNLFVRSDELEAAWEIFTPLLHQLEKQHTRPIPYEFGSRGPWESDALIQKYGYKRTLGYRWAGPGRKKQRKQ